MLSSGPRCGLHCGGCGGCTRHARGRAFVSRAQGLTVRQPAQAQQPGRGLALESRCLCGLLRGCGDPPAVSPSPRQSTEPLPLRMVPPGRARWSCGLQAHSPRRGAAALPALWAASRRFTRPDYVISRVASPPRIQGKVISPGHLLPGMDMSGRPVCARPYISTPAVKRAEGENVKRTVKVNGRTV